MNKLIARLRKGLSDRLLKRDEWRILAEVLSNVRHPYVTATYTQIMRFEAPDR